jgi:S1-C subfamily serine protease
MIARSTGYMAPMLGAFAVLVHTPAPAPAPALPAEPKPALEMSAKRELADVLEGITPAVVNIAVASGTPTETNPLYNDPFFRRYFNLPEQQQRLSAGSGVILLFTIAYVVFQRQEVRA